MGWSGTSVKLVGSGGRSAARRFEKAVWNDLWQFWRSRCTREHHTRLINSEYIHSIDGTKHEITVDDGDGQAGFTITWWLYDYGPQSLFLHWIDLGLAYQREKFEGRAKRYGFEAVTGLPQVESLLQKPGRWSTIFVDTDDDLLQVSSEPLRYDDRVMVERGADGPVQRALDEYPAHVRKAVHRAIEAGECRCPICADLRFKLDP